METEEQEQVTVDDILDLVTSLRLMERTGATFNPIDLAYVDAVLEDMLNVALAATNFDAE